MRDLRDQDRSYQEIASELDRSLLTVIRYLSGKTFRDELALAA